MNNLAFAVSCTECPKIYRKSVLHLPNYTKNLYAVQICGNFWDTQYDVFNPAAIAYQNWQRNHLIKEPWTKQQLNLVANIFEAIHILHKREYIRIRILGKTKGNRRMCLER